MKHITIAAIGLATSLASTGNCEWVTLFVDQDTTVLESFPNQVQDPTDEVLRISSFDSAWFNGKPGRERVLLRFDTDSLVSGNVSNATFQIYQTDDIIYPGRFLVEQLSTDWDQNKVTWSNQPQVHAEPIGLLMNGSNQWLQFENDNLATVIETWLRSPDQNHGLRIRFDDEFFTSNPNGTRGDSFRSVEVVDELPASITFLLCGPCLADLDLNGQLDFFDISGFLAFYQLGDLRVDFTEDGMLDFFDVSAFLNAFNTGCP